MSEKKNVLIVMNPASGDGRSHGLLKTVFERPMVIEKFETMTGLQLPRVKEAVLYTTQNLSWEKNFESALSDPARGIDAVMTIGGDGTLTRVASLLNRFGSKAKFIALPGGRGNDFVRTLYGFSAIEGSFWEWASTSTSGWVFESLDLASADGRVFLNMASIGYGGRVVETAQNRKAFWSKTSMVYQVEGALALLSSSEKYSAECNVIVDGKIAFSGLFFGGFVGNGKANGNGLFWTNKALLNDGMINSVFFPKPGLLEMARTMGAIKKGKPPKFVHQEVIGKEIRFEFNQPVPLELDGDFVYSAMHYGFKCLPAALNAWVIKK